MNKKPYFVGLLQALGVAVYCVLISCMFYFLNKLFLNPPAFWGMAFMLMVLVFSAAVSGILVFGYPVYLALNKEIKKALQVLLFTLLFCLLFAGLIILVLFVF